MRFWVRWSAWLCLSLMFWMAAVESTHTHPSPPEAATCTICAVAHTATPAVNMAQNAPVFVAIGSFHEESINANARIDFSHFGIRGPPVIL
jgi:hypothetical protein